jgi:uncharacterized protein DUF4258
LTFSQAHGKISSVILSGGEAEVAKPVDQLLFYRASKTIKDAIAERNYELWLTDHAEDRATESGLIRGDIIEALGNCRIESCQKTEDGGERYVAIGKTLDEVEVAVVVEITVEETVDLFVITVWTR